MPTLTIRKTWYVNGVPTNPESIVLSDSTGAYGIRRDDTGAVIVAADTPMNEVSTGVFEYTVADAERRDHVHGLDQDRLRWRDLVLRNHRGRRCQSGVRRLPRWPEDDLEPTDFALRAGHTAAEADVQRRRQSLPLERVSGDARKTDRADSRSCLPARSRLKSLANVRFSALNTEH